MKKANFKSFFDFYIILFLVILTYGCKSVKPDKPQEAYLEPSIENNMSSINIPVEYSLRELEGVINKQFSGLIFEDEGTGNGNNKNFDFKIWKRENISILGDSDIFHIKVPLKVWAKTDLSLKELGINISESKDTEFEIDLHFATKIELDSTYKVRTQTIANGYDWKKKPVLKMGFFQVSLGTVAEPMVKKAQEELSKKLDEEISNRLDLKRHVELAWNKIQKPLLISKEHKAWLQLTPTEISMTPVHAGTNRVNATVGIKAITRTYFGDQPEDIEASVLPPLQLKDSIDEDFMVLFSGKIAQTRAEEILNEKFLNKKFTFKNGKREVTITSLDLYGSGGNLVIEADLVGSIDGKVYLTGKPHYDPQSQSLVVHDLDYDLSTKDRLAKTANWLLKGKMVKNMEESLKIPLESQMNQAKAMITERLTNNTIAKGVILNGTLDELQPADVFITKDDIIALVRARGKADIKIKGL